MSKNYTPIDILEYILDNEKEADFMVSLTMHKCGYSIGELTDLELYWDEERLFLRSKLYKINNQITDEDIMVASKAGKYISAFLSRYNDTFQVHFLVHECMIEDKNVYEDEIAQRVIQYMILKTIKQLRLDTPDKVDEYIS